MKIIIVFMLIMFSSISCFAEPQKDLLMSKLKIMSREEITGFIHQYASKNVCIDDLAELSSLLSDKDNIQATGDLSSKIQVRDVALVCIEELTGESFLLPNKTYPVKAIFLYKQKSDDRVWRFSIPTLSDDEFKQVQLRINLWINDFKKNKGK
jgi:hypothetical protein